MKLSDLDTIIDRRGSGCLKYDFAVQRGKPKDVLPFWVADMDFKVAKPILDALEKRVHHGIFGYSESGDAYFKALAGWQENGTEVAPFTDFAGAYQRNTGAEPMIMICVQYKADSFASSDADDGVILDVGVVW